MHGYSTGMKQRVKLAQAIAHDPKLLFLDEPTNGLDPEGRDEMLALIERVGREFGIAIVMSSHLLNEIERVCDGLVLIEQGRLVRAGRIAELTDETSILLVELEGDAGAAGGATARPGHRGRGRRTADGDHRRAGRRPAGARRRRGRGGRRGPAAAAPGAAPAVSWRSCFQTAPREPLA